MINPDEFPHSDLAYPLWIKTHITPTQLKAGVTADKKDVIPFESPSPNFGIHRYQFLLYPQKGKTVMLKSKLALTRLLRVAEFEGYNKANATLPAQTYLLLMIDADEFPNSEMVYPHWIKAHMTRYR
ncbi:Hypothetical predicted protein [Octopus vulgaris]|uniref:Phosphatidylethanolamine-binding protein n=1 Tax=Octopus vulgaris TaxID=6645 RepID=A0AA36B909_OCTVU|nr:Hypothetical predicted protein [Octopus vulgaris]